MARETRPYSENQKPSSTRSGCTIGITMIAVATFLVSWSIYTFVRQDRAIDRFTTDAPLELKIAPPAAGVAAALEAKLAAFAGDPPAKIELTVDDLNALVATRPELETINGVVRVDAIADGTVDASVSLPMRKLGSQQPRYLNGTVRFTPRAADGQFFFDLVSIDATEGEIDTGFITNYRNERYLDSLILGPFQEIPTVWEKIQSITNVEVTDGMVVLERSVAAGAGAD